MYKTALLVATGAAALMATPAEARHHHRHYYRHYYSYPSSSFGISIGLGGGYRHYRRW